MIGIIGAMQTEVDAILEHMTDVNTIEKFGRKFYKGKIEDQEVILSLSGVGKVNAAASTTLLLTLFEISEIINIGTAGGIDPNQNTLDVVVSENVIQHDFDTSYIDGPEGIGIVAKSDKSLRQLVEESFKEIDVTIHYGDIISGDVFVGEESKILELKDKFPTAIACEMEAGAIGQVAEIANIPFIVIRSLSDIVHHDNSGIDFMKNAKITSKRSAEMLKQFMKIRKMF